MGPRQRRQKSQSVQFVAKSFAASFVVIGFLISSCGHPSKTIPADIREALKQPNAPTLDVSNLGIQLTKFGDNDSPFLSIDGRKIVFVSRKRSSHQQSQIYLYDLETLKEKRITYQDGECLDPILVRNNQQVIYASSTDELKESPLLLRREGPKEFLPPTELYQSDLLGSDIVRLTERPDFDGQPWPRPDKPDQILYSSWNGKFIELWQMDLHTKKTAPFLVKKDRSIESFRLSPDGKKWAWIEHQKLEIGNVVTAPFNLRSSEKKVLSLPKGDYKHVTWLTNDKVVFTGKSLKKFYQLYSYDLNTQCLQSLFDSNTDLSSPQVHPEGQGIVFVSTSIGISNLFYKSIPTSDQCLKWDDKTESAANATDSLKK